MGKWYNTGTLDATCFGKIFQYIDYEKKAGTKFYNPQQLVDSFYQKMPSLQLGNEINGWFTANRDKILQWAIEYQQKKPEIFGRNTPLEKRLRFGTKEIKYDINFGLKTLEDGVYGFISDAEFNALLQEYDPWSNKHVHEELKNKFNKNLAQVLNQLIESPIEEKLSKYWLENYYKAEYPALVPQLCGTKDKFWVNKDEFGAYKLADADFGGNMSVVRFDFGVINYRKQKKLLIELDGHEGHKTKTQRNNDAVKRKIATKHGWNMLVFTGTQITNEFGSVTEELKEYFLP